MSKDGDGAEEALSSGEQELRLLVETIPTLVWRAAPDGNIEYVNRRVLEYFGAPLDDIVGWGWAERVHPDDVAFKVRNWLKSLETENPHDVVCRFRGADGRYRWFNVRGEPLRASDGTVLSWYGVLIDIDDRRKAEEALRESEYKLRQIIDTVPGLTWSTGSDGSEGKKAELQPGFMAQVQAILNVLPAYIWYAPPSGSLTFVNKRQADFLGVPEDHPLRFGIDTGAPWDAHIPFLHPDDQEDGRKYWSNSLRTGEGYEHNYRVRTAQGDYRWFHTRTEPLKASDGTVLLWVGATLDIEQLKRAEEGLRESEHKLSQIIETVPSLLWSLGPDGEQTQLNQRALDYIGVRFEDLLHLGWTKFLHPDDLSETAKAFSHAIQTGTSYEAVHRIRRADGEYRWHHARGEPLRDRQGRIVQWYGLSVDIDEGKKAEDRLRRSEAYLAEAQRLSHTGSFGWTPSTGELHWSDETFRILEYDPSIKPTIERVLQRIHPDDRAMIRQLIDETSSGEKDFDVTHRLLMPDGSVKFVHVLSHALKDAAGNLEVVAAVMDVTENTLLYRDLAEREARLVERTAALRRSEAHLAEAQRLSHTGSAVYNDTTILYWSDETYRIFEFDPLKGLPSREAVFQRFHPDDQERATEVARRAVSQKRDYRLEYRIVLPAGTIKHIELTAHPKFSASGELVEVVSTLMDVTERKRAAEALRESEYKLRQITETVPGLIWSLDPDGEPAYFNQRFLDYFGKPFEDFKHGGWLALIHPDDVLEAEKTFSHAIQTGVSYQDVLRFRRADGEYRWHEGRGEPLRDQQGRIVQWYGLSVDIEERKQAEDRLRRSEAYLAEAQRLGHSGVAAYNETAILYGSEEVFRIWGFDPAQGVPSREAVFQRIHPDDRDRLNEEVQRAVGEKRRYSTGYRIVLPDGTVKHLEVIGQPEFSASGELVEIVTTQIDVTERKRVEERFRVQHTVAQILAEAVTIEEATLRILRAMGECLGWDVGALWRVDQKVKALRCVELWHKASIEVPEFERVSREFTFGPGLGLPGRVWSSLEPEYIPDVVPDENFPRASVAEREELHAALAFPILLGGAALGVIEFFSREIRQPDQELLNVLATIGSQIGQFIERKRAEEAVRESERRSRAALDGIAGLVAVLAPNGEVETVNRQCFEYFGRSLEG